MTGILTAGTRLQQYAIKRVLGKGNFGITYLATDTQLNQQVAIKEYLPSELAYRNRLGQVKPKTEHDQDMFKQLKQRFLHEGQTLARFKHPNMVRVQNYFEHHGTAYLVMEYEHGQSLGELLRKGKRFSEAEIQKILEPLLDGLQVVHTAGIIHRDIKPDNIYIRSNGTPVLLDFGAARFTTNQTQAVTTLLTPGYAPFEQYFSNAKEQGPWSDIYALAAVVYQAISGIQPAEATQRLFAQTNGKPDPMSSARKTCVNCSSHFTEALDKALKLKGKDRPRNIEQWRQQLFRHRLDKFAMLLKPRIMLTTVASMVLLVSVSWGIWYGFLYTGHLKVITPHEDVNIYLNRTLMGKTNQHGVFEIADITMTKIDIQLEKKGFKTQHINTTIKKGQWNTLEIKLKPLLAQLSVATHEDISTVYINNAPYLIADMPWQLGAGEYHLMIKANRYQTWQTKMHLKANEQYTIRAALTNKTIEPAKIPKAIKRYPLTIITQPQDASIKIMNIKPKYYPGIPLPAGRYNIKVSHSNYLTLSKTILIQNKAKRVKLELDKKKHSPLITSKPKEALERKEKNERNETFDEVKKLIAISTQILQQSSVHSDDLLRVYRYQQKVLALSPENLEAKKLLIEVAEGFVKLAEKENQKENLEESFRLVNQGLSLFSNYDGLIKLHQQLKEKANKKASDQQEKTLSTPIIF